MSAGKWMGVLKQRQADLPKVNVYTVFLTAKQSLFF